MEFSGNNNLTSSKHKSNDLVEHTIQLALEMIERGDPPNTILRLLVEAAERIAGNDSVCSILMLDKDGLLRNSCSPKLPYDYLTAIDGLKPNPALGTCASAAATGCMVITKDFKSDDKWAELRHLPLALGFAGAWSMPVKTETGKVLGTFGTYFIEKREPSKEEVNAVQRFADIVAMVLS
jgi:GAF domain-containing protein